MLVRKTLPSLKLTSLEILLRWLDTFKIPYDFNRTDMIIYTVKKNRFIIRALDDPRKIKSLTDVDFLWIDEADELTQSEFLDLSITVRGGELPPGHYRQITMTFNPGSYANWIREMFFDNPAPEIKNNTDIFHFTYKDNKYLSAEDRAYLENLKYIDYYKYTVDTLGKWGVLRNKVYENYTVEEFDHPLDWYDDLFGGVDFGFNNPSAFVLIGLKDEELYIIDEIYARRLLNSELISMIKEKLKEYELYDLPLYCDSAEPDRIREFLENDLYVYPAKKDVMAGINTVKRYKIHIHPRCTNFIREISEYKFRENEKGEPIEEVVKVNDHLMDAMRMAVYTRLGQAYYPSISVL